MRTPCIKVIAFRRHPSCLRIAHRPTFRRKEETLLIMSSMPLTSTQLHGVQRSNKPVRIRVHPPHSDDPTLMEDVYLDTATLDLLYTPPISLTGQAPALSNLSAVFNIDHPILTSDINQQHDGSTFIPEYYIFSSYIIPSALLSVSNRCNGDYYDVPFQATDEPAALYYDYNSYKKKHAFYEVRPVRNGTQMIYLKPVMLTGVEPPRNKVIKGVMLRCGSELPDEAFAFQVFRASISSPVQDAEQLTSKL